MRIWIRIVLVGRDKKRKDEEKEERKEPEHTRRVPDLGTTRERKRKKER